jgi:flagellar basal-body rod protein FlgG
VSSGGKGEVLGQAEVGGGVRLASLERDHSMGALSQTGEVLHVAVNGDAWITLEDHNGQPMFTRDGTLSLDGNGTLRHVSGRALMGDIRVPDDAESVVIADDGTVSAVLAGDTRSIQLGRIELATFTNANGLRSLGGNAFAATEASGMPIFGAEDGSQLLQGFLEQSNVDVAGELVAMITAQRAYELNSKVIQAADEAMSVAANLRR